MPVRRILANDKVADDAGKVALQRGPLVYCIERPDVKDGHVLNLLVPDDAVISAEFNAELLGGVEVLKGEATSLRLTEDHKIEKEKVQFTAIPYYAWANRGPGQMAVWLPRQESAARPLPYPTIASTSKRHASSPDADAIALNDQCEPKSSGDHSNRYLHWWPRKGTKEWVQYDFAKPARVSARRHIGSTTPGRANAACRNHGNCSTAKMANGNRWPIPANTVARPTAITASFSMRWKPTPCASRCGFPRAFPRGFTNGV